jgi:hypothetical protein
MEDGKLDAFQVKRRRLLEQSDWLGLDIAAPINVSSSVAFDAITKFNTK